jgi:hypothetical protein
MEQETYLHKLLSIDANQLLHLSRSRVDSLAQARTYPSALDRVSMSSDLTPQVPE